MPYSWSYHSWPHEIGACRWERGMYRVLIPTCSRWFRTLAVNWDPRPCQLGLQELVMMVILYLLGKLGCIHVHVSSKRSKTQRSKIFWWKVLCAYCAFKIFSLSLLISIAYFTSRIPILTEIAWCLVVHVRIQEPIGTRDLKPPCRTWFSAWSSPRHTHSLRPSQRHHLGEWGGWFCATFAGLCLWKPRGDVGAWVTVMLTC